ncbi:zinc ribbon domain-containing protein [Bifidobacterium sp. LC6]|uniref:Zinc ribbon domain-containing protein n=1 Tax=Bifidobacterium colobi TaxID=2809026 RepID=A0ABS5UX21_9BIFI|nr:zinc ribbon domain-containing protein [Bifidobacterium colobi]MBT1175615.1 zinc ribbon domain-containing protein [Bifidobacterium colobi]
MFCRYCGQPNQPEAKFCAHCGKAILQQPAAPTIPMPPMPADTAGTSTPRMAPPLATPVNQKRSRALLYIILAAAMVVVLIIGGGIVRNITSSIGIGSQSSGIDPVPAGNSSENVSVYGLSVKKAKFYDAYDVGRGAVIDGPPTDGTVFTFTIDNKNSTSKEVIISMKYQYQYTDNYGEKRNATDEIESNDLMSSYSTSGKVYFAAPNTKQTITAYYPAPSDASAINDNAASDSSIDITSATITNITVASSTPVLATDQIETTLKPGKDGHSVWVEGTITNNTKDKWRSATLYYEMTWDGYPVIRAYTDLQYLAPGAKKDIDDGVILTKEDPTLTLRPTYLHYQIDDEQIDDE